MARDLKDTAASFVLIQLGDLHIGADWISVDPLTRLAETIDAVCGLDLDVNAVLVLGDIAQHGSEDEYAQARRQLERIAAPLHVAAGNRDDRETLRRSFGLSPAAGACLHYIPDVGPVRLIVLDTMIAEKPSGDRASCIRRSRSASATSGRGGSGGAGSSRAADPRRRTSRPRRAAGASTTRPASAAAR
jgi:hypothetical protein